MNREQRNVAGAEARASTQHTRPGADTIDGDMEQVFGHLRGGRLREAEMLLRNVLEIDPDHAEALHSLGMIAVHVGRNQDAIALFRRAIAQNADDATYHANLGAALEDTDSLQEALVEYRRALELDPGFADMHYRLGNAYVQLGAPEKAVAEYERTVALQPDLAEAHYNLGNARTQSGLHAAAIEAYQRTIELIPRFAQVHCNLGNVLHRLGRYEEAARCQRRAVELKPDFALAFSNLGNSLSEVGCNEEALAAYDRAVEIEPGYARAHSNRGVCLKALDRLEEAVAAYRNAIDAQPDFPDAHFNLGNALRASGRLDEAVQAYGNALDCNPDHAFACSNIGNIRIEQGNPAAALELCDRFLAGHPGDTGVLACKALALDEMGRRPQTRYLVDFDRLVMARCFDAPAGFASIDEFNAALQRHILDHPTLVDDPATHATRYGKHTGDLVAQPTGPIAFYEQMIHQAVSEYMRTHPIDPTHPFLADPPKDYRLSVWAVVMNAQGHQIAHIHPSAWLSGCYYAKVPAVVQSCAEEQAGWIEFGQTGDDYRYSVKPDVRAYQPEEGKMFLFPSYFWHRTIPFETDDLRISIAFDVIPERG